MDEVKPSIIVINEDLSNETANTPESVPENVEKQEDISYEIFEEDSNKGSFKLFDSLGYSYEVEREGVSCTSWQCVNRNKRLKCPASVKQCGNTFIRNSYKHVDAPTSNVFLMSKINICIRRVASEDLIRPASHIVQEVLNSFNLDVDSLSKTKYTFLLRLANKVRQGLRPELKKRPKIVVLKKELSDTPVKFIEIDLYNDEVNTVSQVTPPEADSSYELLADPFSKENLKLFDSSGYSYVLKKVKNQKKELTRRWLCTIRNKHHMCLATVDEFDQEVFTRGTQSHSHPPRANALAMAKLEIEMKYAAVENGSSPCSFVVDQVLERHPDDQDCPLRRHRSYWVKVIEQFREKLGRDEMRKVKSACVKPSLREADEGITYEVVEELSARRGRKLFDSLGYSYTVRRKKEVATIWSCRVTRSTSQCPVTVKQIGDVFQRNNAQHSHSPQKDSLLRAKFTIDLRRKVSERRERTTTQIVNEVLHDYKNKGVLMPSLSKFSSLVQYVKKCKRTLRNEELNMETATNHVACIQPKKEEFISTDVPIAETFSEVKTEIDTTCENEMTENVSEDSNVEMTLEDGTSHHKDIDHTPEEGMEETGGNKEEEKQKNTTKRQIHITRDKSKEKTDKEEKKETKENNKETKENKKDTKENKRDPKEIKENKKDTREIKKDTKQTKPQNETKENKSESKEDKKEYKCSRCRFESKRKSILKLHDLTDHRNLYKLKCKRCGHHNKRKFRLKLDRIKATKEWILKCAKCTFVTSNYKQLKQHQLQHFKGNKLKCTKCLIQFDIGKCE